MEAGTSHREQGEEHADGWWNEEHVDGWWKDEQTGSSSSSGRWMTAKNQAPWEAEGREGGFEIKCVQPKYIKHDRWGQECLMLNYDSGAAVTALLVADLLLEKRGEFRVARSIRGHITEVAKPPLRAADVSKRWDSLLFEDGGILSERNSPVAFEVRPILKKAQGLDSSWQEHQTLPRRQLVQRVCAMWRCHTRACIRTSRGELDQTWRNGRGRWRS